MLRTGFQATNPPLSLLMAFWLLYFQNFAQILFERSLFHKQGTLNYHTHYIQCLITYCAKLLKFDWIKTVQLIRNCTAENNTEWAQKL